jgi:hypothetical protein
MTDSATTRHETTGLENITFDILIALGAFEFTSISLGYFCVHRNRSEGWVSQKRSPQQYSDYILMRLPSSQGIP